MSDNEKGNSNKEEVVVLAGVRARMAAYQQEISRKDKRKNTKPVFKVAEDLGTSIHSIDGLPVRDKMPVGEEQTDRSLSHNVDNDDDDAQAFQRSMNNSSKNLFDLEAGDEEDIEPEKPQEVKDEEENLAKQKISALLKRDDDETETGDEPEIVLQAFSAVQRRYLKAVQKLRPEPMAIKKPEKPEEAPAVKDVIRKKLNREMTKSTHLSELTMTWDDYYEKAQDKPTEETEVKQVEEEIKKVEEEVNSEWAEFAKEVVEIVGEEPGDSSAMEEDEDMVKWREEARRLKSEAEERKKQKAVREERKKKRAQIAALRKKRAEDAAKKKAEEAAMLEAEEETRRSELQRIEDERKATEEQTRARMEEAERKQVEEMATSGAPASKKKGDASDSDSDSSASSGSSSSGKERQAKAPTSVPPKKGRNKATGDSDSDSDSSVEEKAKKKSKKKKKKKDKDKEKKKEEDIIKVEEKKSKKKKKDGKKKGDEDSDLDDGWVEEYPRNLDGSLWKNPLKFWTNKPKKLNEVAPKVIMKPNPNSDIFCKAEDAINDNASFYWHKFEGDFNVLCKIKGNLNTSYDKAGIMIRQDERNWVMSGLEIFNKRINHSSCITRGISDWSLAPLPDEAKDGIWIAIKRHSNKVECFYSFDLKEWIQTRQGLFPTTGTLKVGIVCACPMGDPFKVVFERFRIQMVG